jgi:hypothetical protein
MFPLEQFAAGEKLVHLKPGRIGSKIKMPMTTKHRIFTTSFARVYPLYVAKAEKKGRKKSEVDAVICWLTLQSAGVGRTIEKADRL